METGPLEILKLAIDENVKVRLKTGENLEGVLKGFDEHMNLVLLNRTDSLFVRGDTVLLIRPSTYIAT